MVNGLHFLQQLCSGCCKKNGQNFTFLNVLHFYELNFFAVTGNQVWMDIADIKTTTGCNCFLSVYRLIIRQLPAYSVCISHSI